MRNFKRRIDRFVKKNKMMDFMSHEIIVKKSRAIFSSVSLNIFKIN